MLIIAQLSKAELGSKHCMTDDGLTGGSGTVGAVVAHHALW